MAAVGKSESWLICQRGALVSQRPGCSVQRQPASITWYPLSVPTREELRNLTVQLRRDLFNLFDFLQTTFVPILHLGCYRPRSKMDDDNDDDRAPLFVACVTVTSAVAVVLASLRSYVRLRIVRNFGPDDWTSLLAAVYFLTLEYCIWLFVYSYDKRLD